MKKCFLKTLPAIYHTPDEEEETHPLLSLYLEELLLLVTNGRGLRCFINSKRLFYGVLIWNSRYLLPLVVLPGHNHTTTSDGP